MTITIQHFIDETSLQPSNWQAGEALFWTLKARRERAAPRQVKGVALQEWGTRFP